MFVVRPRIPAPIPVRRLFKLPIDPGETERVREYFDGLAERRETFERGLALERMNAEAVLELSAAHHSFFQEVAAAGHDHPDDLIEFSRLFEASARDRIE